MRTTRHLILALALLGTATGGAHAADPPGSLPFDWPMGTHDGTQYIPGYNVRVLQNYANSNPTYGNRRHSAVDLSRNTGSTVNASVHAAADGVVTCATSGLGYPGEVVVVEHTQSNGTKVYTQYGHIAPSVSVGQLVNRGLQIGSVVAWPDDVSNTHLHFEVRTFAEWAPGNCWGPGYAETGKTPGQQGWLDPIDEHFGRRPEFPGYAVTDILQSVRSAPNRNASSVIAQLAPGTRVVADSVWPDQGGANEWWLRVRYDGVHWGYLAAYWDNGWGGDVFGTELVRYPGPVELVGPTSVGNDLYVFARATDGSLRYRRRSSAGGWTGWTWLGGVLASEPAAAVDVSGRVHAFVRGTDRALYYRRQTAAGSSSWQGWTSLGGILTSAPVVATNTDGRLQVFVRWSNGSLRTRAQSWPGGPWGSWIDLGGVISWGPAVAADSSGRLNVFVGGLSNDLFRIAQTTPGGGFGSWQGLGGVMTSHPSAVTNADGRLEVFVRGAAHDLRHIRENTPGGSWGAWQSRGGVVTSHPKVGRNADGRLEVFARGTDGRLKNLWQLSPGGAWSGWSDLGGYLTSGPVVVRQGAALQLLMAGTNGVLWHRGQTGSGWSGFLNLGGSFAPY